MTTAAVLAEAAMVDIVLLVTPIAVFRHFYLLVVLYRILVAFLARQLLMSAVQLEFGLLVVIELPDQPAIGVVTLLAGLAQAPLVHILALMARPAVQFGILIGGRQMAFLTRSHRV